MIISKTHLCTKIPIWSPKYSAEDGWEVLIAKSKVGYASPIIIVEFTKAKHLIGQRFCVRRSDVQKCPIGSNGKIPVYRVPFDMLEGYDTGQEVYDLANNIFEEEL